MRVVTVMESYVEIVRDEESPREMWSRGDVPST